MRRIAIALLPALWLASCGNDTSSGTPSSHASSSQPTRGTLEERCNEKTGFVQDANGNWKPRVDRRSSFESVGASQYFKGNYQTKNCQTTTLESTAWGGSKNYSTKSFAGNSKAGQIQKSARADGVRSREDATVARADGKMVKTNGYKTGEARESGRGEIDRPTDAQTESRSRTYVPPEIIDWQQQRAMSMDETKSILGH